MHQQWPFHRTIMVADVERFSDPARTNLNQLAVRAGFYNAVVQAFRESGVIWGNCEKEDRGDGALILVPPDVSKTCLVTSLPDTLVAAVSRHNALSPPAEQMRLRVALHAGEVYRDGHGVAGAALNHAFRLVEAPVLKSALETSPGVLALIVSDWLFGEIVRHHPAAEPGSYRQVDVIVKETSVQGWIRIPDPDIAQTFASPVDDLPSGNGTAADLRASGGHLGSIDAAVDLHQNMLGILNQTQSGWQQGNVLKQLADACRDQGRIGHAIGYYQRARTAFQKIGDDRAEANILVELGRVQRVGGLADEARLSWQLALRIFDKTGDTRAEKVRAQLRTLGDRSVL